MQLGVRGIEASCQSNVGTLLGWGGWRPVGALAVAGLLVAVVFVEGAHGQSSEGMSVQGKPVAAPVEAPKTETKPAQAEESRDSLRGDVGRSVDFGFIRDPGASPVLDHRIKGMGISVPNCVGGSPDCK